MSLPQHLHHHSDSDYQYVHDLPQQPGTSQQSLDTTDTVDHHTHTNITKHSAQVTLQMSDQDMMSEITRLQNELQLARAELSKERKRRQAAEEHAKELRRESTLNQIRVEEEEEMISNKLMKRLSELKQEKEQIARASESDSEWVTNSLSQRLDALQKQKHKIIAAAEEENEFIVNRLNKELEALRQQKIELERKVQHLSRSTTPGALTPTSSPALSFRSIDGPNSATNLNINANAITPGGATGTGTSTSANAGLSRNSSYRLSTGSSSGNINVPSSSSTALQQQQSFHQNSPSSSTPSQLHHNTQ